MNQDEVTNLLAPLFDLRETLGYGATDTSAEVVHNALNAQTHISKVRKDISRSAGVVSYLVGESETNPELTNIEKENLEEIKDFGKNLGNFQYKLNELNKKSEQMEKIAESMAQDGIYLGEDIIKLQDQARKITSIFRRIGFKVPVSDLQKFLTVDPNNS